MTAAAKRRAEASLLILALIIATGGNWLASAAAGKVSVGPVAGYAAMFLVVYLGAHLAVRKFAPAADPLLLPIALLLNGLGFVLIGRLGRSDPSLAGLAGAQGRWVIVGAAGMALTLWAVRDARVLQRYRYTWGVTAVVLLMLPILPVGREVNGARLWIKLGPLNFQPAELGKIALVLFFAGYLAEKREVLAVATRRLGRIQLPDLRHFGPVLLAWGLSLLVMVRERDLGSSLLFFTVFVLMLWIATGRKVYLVVGLVLFLVGAFGAYHLFGHVRDRIQVWQDPFFDSKGKGFQLVQSLFALATGGAWGTGLGLGRPDLIPSVHTDFIFSALGEELGIAGAAAVLCAFALFSTRAFALATRMGDDFTKLLVSGLAVTFSVQTLIIIGGVTRLVPLTGITLPFMSYGGSSLLSNFIIVGLLTRASDQAQREGVTGPPTQMNVPAGGGR